MDDHDGVAVGICGTDRGRAGRDGGIAERLALASDRRQHGVPDRGRAASPPNPATVPARCAMRRRWGGPNGNRAASPAAGTHSARTDSRSSVERPAAPPHGFDQRRTQRTVQHRPATATSFSQGERQARQRDEAPGLIGRSSGRYTVPAGFWSRRAPQPRA